MGFLFFVAQKVDLPIPKPALNNASLQTVLSIVFATIGAFAILYLLVGAIRYAISNGDQSAITQAKNTIMYALVGLAISVSAFTIVQFVLGRVSS